MMCNKKKMFTGGFRVKRVVCWVMMLGISACSGPLKHDAIWGISPLTGEYWRDEPPVVPLLAYFQRMHDVESVCFSVDALLPTFFARGWPDEPSEHTPTAVLASQPVLQLMGAHCELRRAWQHELEMLKYARRGDKTLAKDHDILRERSLSRAVTLYWQGYRAIADWLMADAGILDETTDQCQLVENLVEVEKGEGDPLPKRRLIADSESEQLMLLAASLNGFMATLYDQMLSHPVGVPAEVAHGARFMVACVDNARWWSLPKTLSVALKSLSSSADRASFRATLKADLAESEPRDVRWAAVITALMLARWEGQDAVFEVMPRFFGDYRYSKNDQWLLWDKWAVEHMVHFSDQAWMKATGTRTPAGLLGEQPKLTATKAPVSSRIALPQPSKAPPANRVKEPAGLDLKDVL